MKFSPLPPGTENRAADDTASNSTGAGGAGPADEQRRAGLQSPTRPRSKSTNLEDSASRLSAFLDQRGPDLIRFRRDVHAHPELGRQERRTTGRIVEQLTAAGLSPRVLPHGTGVICDIDPAQP